MHAEIKVEFTVGHDITADYHQDIHHVLLPQLLSPQLPGQDREQLRRNYVWDQHAQLIEFVDVHGDEGHQPHRILLDVLEDSRQQGPVENSE